MIFYFWLCPALCCCTQAFPSWSEWGLLFIAGCRLLHCCRLLLQGMALGHTGFSSVVPGLWSPGTWWWPAPLTRRVFPAPGTEPPSLYHGAARKPKVRLLLRPLLLAYREPPSCRGLPQLFLSVCRGRGESQLSLSPFIMALTGH